MSSSEYGQTAVRELCNALEETFSTLSQMTERTNSEDLRPAPLPSNKKSLEFTRAVLKHSFTPFKLAELVKALRDMRSDVQMCFTGLESSFEHVHTLYGIMNNGLARTASRTSLFSTSTNLTVRIKLAAWLKKWEGTWGLSRLYEPTSVSNPVSTQTLLDSHFRLQLHDFLQSKHMTVVGISRMTEDLLGEIFYHLCARGPLPLRHVLFVSRGFHFAAVNDARLWTTISFDALFFRHFKKRAKQGNRFVEECLLRSGSLPLCLYIDTPNILARDITAPLHTLETFGKPELRGFQRCTSLIWNNQGYGAAVQNIVALLPNELPSLKHISLTSFHDPIDGSQFPDCPALERAEISNHSTHNPHFWGDSFVYVTTLSFGTHASWEDCDMITLSLFPVLYDLTLFTGHGRRDLHGIYQRLQQPITFPHLLILRVRGHIPPGGLTMLVAPTLKELHLKANDKHLTSLDSLQNSFEPLCQYIYALLPEAVRGTEPRWATNLSWLVDNCTRIRALYVSKWMEEEWQRLMPRRNVVLHVQ